jgi:5-methyltetrahydrofolate--homocysteine methyltransferase
VPGQRPAAGVLSSAGGEIPFGAGSPTLLVNDQMGYCYEDAGVLARLQAGDLGPLLDLARLGQSAGMSVINVQLMERSLDEAELLPRVARTLSEEAGCAIAVDTRQPAILERTLAAYPYKAMCNVVNGEAHVLATMLPIIARYGGAVGTALVYEKGVPLTLDERLLVARRIVEAAEAHGIPRQDVMIDCICLPSAVMPDSMRVTLQTIAAVKEELGAPTLLGISNAGYLMPDPTLIDLAFLTAAVSWGLDVAMVNPATPLIAEEIRAIDFLTGKDAYAKGYLKWHRRKGAAGAPAPKL